MEMIKPSYIKSRLNFMRPNFLKIGMLDESLYKLWKIIFSITLAIIIILAFLNFWYVSVHAGYDKQYTLYAAELRVLFERFTRVAGEAVLNAKPEAFTYLDFRTKEFTGILEILKRGKQDSTGAITLPPSPRQIQDKELAEISALWGGDKGAKANAEIILANKQLVLSLHETINNVTTALEKIQLGYLEIIGLLENRTNVTGKDFAEMATQIFNAQELEQNIRSIVNPSIDSTEIVKRFQTKVAAFGQEIKDLQAKYVNDAIYSKLMDIDNTFTVVRDRTQEIIADGQAIAKVNAAYQAIYNLYPTFLEDTANLERVYADLASKRFLSDTTAYILSGLALLNLIILLFFIYKDNQATLRISEDTNKALQDEMRKLVDDLKDLANGNLTVKATANMEVTSAIAEGINYALNALRRLVKGINQTSNKVSGSAQDVKKITNELVKAMNNQAQEIVNTTNSVSSMASSIDQVSVTAKKSAQVAENSLHMAQEGAEVVQNTISGMDRIREQIRETEKRIRRLGESSQEIGEIVSLIDGISEQTNILSLNAAIQAAMAGEAGMGFAVVADEVQQLAVKSSQAAKEVETIVKTIRADSARATESMEHAITEVTTGTKLAHDAGLALEKIENVSKNLAELIQGISMAAEEQARVSSKINRMMEIVESIARETASGTADTAESIDNLASQVRDLKSSVAEFKLPEEAYGA